MEHSPERHQQFSRPAAEVPQLMPIDHNLVQMQLAAHAFPDADVPLDPWLEADGTGHSFAERFRAYVESPEHQNDRIDHTDETKLQELLEAVRRQALH